VGHDISSPFAGFLQGRVISLDDSLREPAWWDLRYYHLDVRVMPETKSIAGSVAVHYSVIEPSQVLQIDLHPPLKINRVTQDGRFVLFQERSKCIYDRVGQASTEGRMESLLRDLIHLLTNHSQSIPVATWNFGGAPAGVADLVQCSVNGGPIAIAFK
jgi:hypothetical protein